MNIVFFEVDVVDLAENNMKEEKVVLYVVSAKIPPGVYNMKGLRGVVNVVKRENPTKNTT